MFSHLALKYHSLHMYICFPTREIKASQSDSNRTVTSHNKCGTLVSIREIIYSENDLRVLSHFVPFLHK